TVTNNRISNVGANCYDAGIDVYGHDNTFSGTSVSGTGGQGISVYGDRNSFDGDTVNDCGFNGFHMEPSCSDNVLKGVRATNCDGEGLQNRAFSTDVTKSTFTGNRTDVTNSGSFEQSDNEFESSNRYDTGGPEEESDVECDE
ncbi:MAG: right-handed parallel beta-helix repeat-containing protein, partial [Planctomycetota bacterium]